jgi:hypothetical protein
LRDPFAEKKKPKKEPQTDSAPGISFKAGNGKTFYSGESWGKI